PGGQMQPWIDALMDIDFQGRGDKRRLLELLRSDTELPPEARWYLADLIERYELKRPRGGQRTPAYQRSDTDAKLSRASKSLREYVAQGRKLADVMGKVADTWGVDAYTLRNYHEGKHASARRMKKRRPPTKL